MGSLNKVMLIGNLTREPEVRYTPKGSAVCDLGVAVNRTYMTDSGEKMQETTYVDVVVWARLAELAAQYLHKGRAVFIEGRLQMDTWEDKQSGQKRSKLRVVADNLQFLDSRRDEEGGFSNAGHESGGYQGGNGGSYQQRQGAGGFQQRGGGGGQTQRQGSGYQQQRSAPQRNAPAGMDDDFGDGPLHGDNGSGGMDDDEIPF
jgi:single-strand DNA-binding protein